MLKTAEFLTFMDLYNTVMDCAALKFPEKTAAIEAAADEYLPRSQPAAYRAIVQRLAARPPKEPDVHIQDSPPPAKEPAAADAQAGRARRVASRAGR